jgi:hypothetical protein
VRNPTTADQHRHHHPPPMFVATRHIRKSPTKQRPSALVYRRSPEPPRRRFATTYRTPFGLVARLSHVPCPRALVSVDGISEADRPSDGSGQSPEAVRRGNLAVVVVERLSHAARGQRTCRRGAVESRRHGHNFGEVEQLTGTPRALLAPGDGYQALGEQAPP